MPPIPKPNVWINAEDDPSTLLTYALQTNPAPLVVSDPDDPRHQASLEFVISNQTSETVNVAAIVITLWLGSAGTDITPSMDGVQNMISDTANWMVLGPFVGEVAANYRLVPAAGATVPIAPGGSVYLQLYEMKTVPEAGTTTISILEETGAQPPWNDASTDIQVTTFPYGFYFNGLTATTEQDGSLVPVSQVGYGDSVTLIWNCSVVDTQKAFTVYYSSAAGQGTVEELRNSSWTSRRLFCDTVFTVVVDVVGPTGAPLTAAMSTTVAVQDPDLVATSLTAGSATITGAATLSGTTTTGTLLAGDVTASSLTSTGALGVSGQTVLAGAGMSAANVSGPLTVSGVATLTGGLDAAGGQVTMLGPVVALAAPTTTATHVKATTDGFAVMQITWPNTKPSWAQGRINLLGQWFVVEGGVIVAPPGGGSTLTTPNVMTVPIPADTDWWYDGAAITFGSSGGEEPAGDSSIIQLFWFPLGNGSIGNSYEIVPLDETTEVPGPPLADVGAVLRQREARARNLVDKLSRAFGHTLDDGVRNDLVTLFSQG
ncbi:MULTISPECIES: hypothetical protein [unclassified Nonomuraea]|uniref:hypothetical protein n=1 Tax=unclassified Nonomuraea TaxID=2593643 RepID=UPI0033EBC415